MLQRNRRLLAAIGLMAVLLLTVSAPAQAVGFWEGRVTTSVATRIWSWLEARGLLGQALAPAPQLPQARWEKEGVGIDPNGVPIPPPCPAPTAATPPDPNGEK